jgi:nucleoside 2-deoxyribosyltransferase
MLCEAYAGTIISGEDAFIAVLKRKSAAADLQTVFEHGTLEAKMYALAGLREIDRLRSEADFTRVGTHYGSVAVLLTEHPSSVLRRSIAEALRNIRAGQYHGYVQWVRTGHFS